MTAPTALDPQEAAGLRHRAEIRQALADMARERRERELDHLRDNIIFENALAEALNRESGASVPPLVLAILEDRLTAEQIARLAVLSDKVPPVLNLEPDTLAAHFAALAEAVLHG